uniref:Uncharacterized protein n=1 Tax=Arundo donax TaxID=35708 RepID=A0A0A9BXA7_ARUDO
MIPATWMPWQRRFLLLNGQQSLQATVIVYFVLSDNLLTCCVIEQSMVVIKF